MTLSLPPFGYTKGLPKLVRSTSVSRAGARAMAFVEYADPYWKIEVETVALTKAQSMLFEALEATAGSGMVTVLYSVPPAMNVPQAYWDNPGAAAPANDGNLVSIAGNVLVINSVTDGLSLKAGDVISLASGDYRALVMLTADAVAASSAITVAVEPTIPSYITAGAVVKFKDPELNVRLLPGSMSITDDYLPVVSFTLVEVPK